MGIGKGKSDKIDIDGLIEGVGNENKVAREESNLEQNQRTKGCTLRPEAATQNGKKLLLRSKQLRIVQTTLFQAFAVLLSKRNKIFFRAKISTDELAKVHQCTVRHIKAEEDLLERHSDKWPNTPGTMKAFENTPLGLYLLWSYWRLVILL